MGLIKEDSCLRKIIYFVKKNIFSASNHGFTTTATEMRALEGLAGDLAKRTKIGNFFKNCPLSIILGCHHAHHHIHSSLSLQKETILFDPPPNLPPPAVPSLNPTVLFTF